MKFDFKFQLTFLGSCNIKSLKIGCKIAIFFSEMVEIQIIVTCIELNFAQRCI